MIDSRLLPPRNENREHRSALVDRFEKATQLILPRDARQLIVDFGNQGLGAPDLEVVIPRFASDSLELLSELDVQDIPDGDWVEGFCEFGGLVGGTELGVPAQAELIRRMPFLAAQPNWAVSLVPIIHTHSSLLNGVVCLDFSEVQVNPPVVIVSKGLWMDAKSPHWDGMWYLASSVSELLGRSRVQEYDEERGGFPFELDPVLRFPSEAEAEWNRRRDERLGRL